MSALPTAYLILRNIPHRDWSFRIDERERLIGRSAESDIWIPDRFEAVSRRHAQIWIEKNCVWLRDLGSRHGTAVNGVWIHRVERAGIQIGDAIWLGGAELEVVGRVDALATVGRHNAFSVEETDLPSRTPPYRYMADLLSPAEIDVMLWISRGYTDYDETGKRLFRSPNTVRTEIEHICKKLGLHSRRDLLELLQREQHYDGSLALDHPQAPPRYKHVAR